MAENCSKNRYEFDGRIRYSEIDHRGTITLPALINYFQDCSIFQSEAIGRGTGRLREEKKAWVLSYWQIIVNRYARLCEKVTTGTFATEFKGLYGYRNFYMNDGSGERIACANSIWVFMDLEKGRPARPTAEHIGPYGTCEPLDMPYEGRKIALPERWETEAPFSVRKYHIDTNEHVNNCQYVQMALEMAPEDIQVGQARVDYKRSAVLGDMVCPKISKEEGRIVVELCGEDGSPYAIVELK